MTGWREPAYAEVARLITRRTGLAFAANRVPEAEAGIRRAMERAGIGQVAEYVRRLDRETDRLDDLVTELVVSETYFFRDTSHFDFILREIVPSLSGDSFRGWSAGCASGEEAYSLAILLDKAGFGSNAHLLATDISRAALGKAARARYGAWSMRGVDPGLVARYFRHAEGTYELDAKIRDRVRLEYLNLALDSYPSLLNGTFRLDLILCRNVLIYLDRSTIRDVARRFAACLAPDGWLITGPSDPLLTEEGLLHAVVTEAGVFHRLSTPVRTTPRAVPPPPTTPPRPMPAPSPKPDPMQEARDAFDRGEWATARELAQHLSGTDAAVLRVRAAANVGDTILAERTAAESVARHPLDRELHVLQATLRIDLERFEDAAQTARRALYLDRSLVIAHFLLGLASLRLGRSDDARRSFRNARDLCAQKPEFEAIPFSDGQTAARLMDAIAAQLEIAERGLRS